MHFTRGHTHTHTCTHIQLPRPEAPPSTPGLTFSPSRSSRIPHLHARYRQHGYTLMMHHYKNTMGVGVAWPREHYELERSVVERISNFITRTKMPQGYDPSQSKVTQSAWERPKAPTTFLGSAWASVSCTSGDVKSNICASKESSDNRE